MGNYAVYVDPANNNEIHLQAPGYGIIVDNSGIPTPTPTPSITPSISVTPTLTPTPSPTPARLEFDVDPSQSYNSTALACAGSPTWYAQAYLEIGYSVPTVGAYFYTDAGGSTGFAPGGCVGPLYYLFSNGGTIWACQVGNNTPVDGCDNGGEILAVSECVDPSPTPTPTITPTITPSISVSVTPSITPSITPTRTPTPTPSSSPVPVPGTISNVTGVDSGAFATCTYTTSSNADNYRIQYALSPFSSWNPMSSGGSYDLASPFTTTLGIGTWRFRVCGENGAGLGPYTTSPSFVMS